jgi:hypothetical protein
MCLARRKYVAIARSCPYVAAGVGDCGAGTARAQARIFTVGQGICDVGRAKACRRIVDNNYCRRRTSCCRAAGIELRFARPVGVWLDQACG